MFLKADDLNLEQYILIHSTTRENSYTPMAGMVYKIKAIDLPFIVILAPAANKIYAINLEDYNLKPMKNEKYIQCFDPALISSGN